MKKIILFICCVILASCKNEKSEAQIQEEKEANTKYTIDSIFNSTIPKNFIDECYVQKTKILTNEIEPFELKGSIYAINFFDTERSFFYSNHNLNNQLIRNGYDVSQNFSDTDYLIFTEAIEEKVGNYIDEKNKKTKEATVTTDYIYVYDMKKQKLSLVTIHRGEEPKEKLSDKDLILASYGRSWNYEDYLDYLETNKFLTKDTTSTK